MKWLSKHGAAYPGLHFAAQDGTATCQLLLGLSSDSVAFSPPNSEILKFLLKNSGHIPGDRYPER